jgi:DNA-binding transcriptional ArsR family regulator
MLNWAALDKIFKSLGHPWRRYMVECLCDGEASVSWLAQHLPLGLPTILEHLEILEQNGLIHTQKVGRERICRIEPHALELLDHWVSPRRRVWDRRLQRLLDAGSG